MEAMAHWNRKRIAGVAAAIMLSIWLPVALAQNYFRYNAYILPLCGLALVLLCIWLGLTGKYALGKIHAFHHGFGATRPFEYMLIMAGCGGLLVVALCGGEWFAIHKSQQHAAELRKADLPKPPTTIPVSAAKAQQNVPTPPTSHATGRPRKVTANPAPRENGAPKLPTVGGINQGPCGVVLVGGTQNTANGGNCNPLPVRSLTDAQKQGIRDFIASIPPSVSVSVGSVYGSGDASNYAIEFFPLFDGRHLNTQVTPDIRTGFPATDMFTDVLVATTTENDSAVEYRNKLVDVLNHLGVKARRVNGDTSIASGNIELLIGFRAEEVKPQ